MKWFSLSVALVCLFALQIVIEAKPVEEDEAAASAIADEAPENHDETPSETPSETPLETPSETAAETHETSPENNAETSAESHDTSAESSGDTAGSGSGSGNSIISEATTKKSWTIEGIHNKAEMIFETIRDGIDTADKALVFYDKLVDRVIPFEEFNQTLVELDNFRKDYSIESATLIGDTKTLMMDGMDDYFSASQNIYEWAGTVTPLLKVYIKLFDKHSEEKAQAQRQLMIKVLEEGITKMTEARINLEKSSKSFNDAGGKLEALQIRFDAEFDEKSEFVQSKILKVKIGAYTGGALFGIPGVLIAHFWAVGTFTEKLTEKLKSIEKFYTELKSKVQNGSTQIDTIKSTLKKEVQHISDLKTQTEETQGYVAIDEISEMRDEVIESAQKLITHCDGYRKRHNNKTDLI